MVESYGERSRECWMIWGKISRNSLYMGPFWKVPSFFCPGLGLFKVFLGRHIMAREVQSRFFGYFLQQLAFSKLILDFPIFFSFQESDVCVCVCVCWGLVARRSRPSLAHQSHVQIRQENMKEEGIDSRVCAHRFLERERKPGQQHIRSRSRSRP